MYLWFLKYLFESLGMRSNSKRKWKNENNKMAKLEIFLFAAVLGSGKLT